MVHEIWTKNMDLGQIYSINLNKKNQVCHSIWRTSPNSVIFRKYDNGGVKKSHGVSHCNSYFYTAFILTLIDHCKPANNESSNKESKCIYKK